MRRALSLVAGGLYQAAMVALAAAAFVDRATHPPR